MRAVDRAAAHQQLDAALDDAGAYTIIEPEVFDGMPEPLRAAMLRWIEWAQHEKREQAHAQLEQHLDANDAMHEARSTGATKH